MLLLITNLKTAIAIMVLQWQFFMYKIRENSHLSGAVIHILICCVFLLKDTELDRSIQKKMSDKEMG